MPVRYYSEDCTFLPKGRTKISSWVRETVSAEGFRTGEVAYIFCSPEYHIDVNRKYLGHDYHTDVITFDYSDLTGRKTVSGDIFIDPQQVCSQAAEWNAQPAEELMRVIIHGILHLCGHNDKTAAQQKKMRALEDKYLSAYKTKYGEFPPFII